ncbi:glycosyltransferase [Guyparkeria sp. SCN-R1]|nr:glycosyltransferase [Guyparkeria sp. SCN-R1]
MGSGGNASRCELNNGELHIVFGGQLEPGRGVDVLVRLAKRLKEERQSVYMHVFGDGRLRDLVVKEAGNEHGSRLIYHGKVSRDEYLEFIRDLDVGLVITVPGVSVPTFPSKVIDYFVAGKPVLAFVEGASDFGYIVENVARAGFSADVSRIEDMYAAILRIKGKTAGAECSSLTLMGQNGRNYFLQNMEVGIVVEKLLSRVKLMLLKKK